MQIAQNRWCGVARAATVAILAGFVGGCYGQSEPAPVYLRGAGEPMMAPMPPPTAAPALQVIVQRGQTLDGYAYTYHLPKSALIAANGLRPPYELKAGQRLVIPSQRGPVQQAAMPRPVRPLEGGAMPAAAARPPQTIFPAQGAATPAQAAPVAQPAKPPEAASQQQAVKYLPEIIPLDGPAPKTAEAAPAKPASLTPPATVPAQQIALSPPQAAGSPPPTSRKLVAGLAVPADSSAATPVDAQPMSSGRFPWPVRGRIVGAYGNAPGGGHNDGINIGAPLGTPVRAIDAGTVVYSGNEVKGYGNIVLIRHSNGWISAYAHLEDVTVKPGDSITGGEVIAKVGNSGGITAPQLHFELRRGKKPVNPTEFLAPAPSAAAPASDAAG